MGLFSKKSYAYYVVFKYKKDNGENGMNAAIVGMNKKVKTFWNLRQLKEEIINNLYDGDDVEILIINWRLMKW